MTDSDHEFSDNETDGQYLSEKDKELCDINFELEKLFATKNNIEDGYKNMWDTVLVPYLKLTDKHGVLDKLDYRYDRHKFFKFMIDNNKTYKSILQSIHSLNITKKKLLEKTQTKDGEIVVAPTIIKSKKKIWTSDKQLVSNMHTIMNDESSKAPVVNDTPLVENEQVIMKTSIAQRLKKEITIYDILLQKQGIVQVNENLGPTASLGKSANDNSTGGNNGLMNEGITVLSTP